MNTLAEIEAAVDLLTQEEKHRLVSSLLARVHCHGAPGLNSQRHSILDIPPVHVGVVLQPANVDDDLLGEMLEGRS